MQKPLSTDKERRFPRAGNAKLAEGLLFKMWRPGYPKSCFQVSRTQENFPYLLHFPYGQNRETEKS